MIESVIDPKEASVASQPQLEREILDKPGASDLLQISTRTLDEWMRKKRIPYAKLPSGTVRFRRSQLLEFIARHEVGQAH